MPLILLTGRVAGTSLEIRLPGQVCKGWEKAGAEIVKQVKMA
jgi:hypothetical protein